MKQKQGMIIGLAAVLIAGLAITGWHFVNQENQPYQGQDERAIASLSSQDVDDLLAGRGWGLALPAELNGYPGPAHVLELADALALSDEQIERVERIMADMRAEAQALGKSYVEIEQRLDTAFETGAIDANVLSDLTEGAATLLGQLRVAHLNAHLEVTPILSDEQIAIYNQKRGYGDHSSGHSGHGSH
ncbi:MAG: Spy/CpxP family protein refolding chaperone [Pseudomonadota bacterium]